MTIKDIKDIRKNSAVERLVATVQFVDKEHEWTNRRTGLKGQVRSALLFDKTGSIKLTLWNEDTRLLESKDRVELENCWCGEFQGECNITKGRYGKITKLPPAQKKWTDKGVVE